MYAYPYLYIIIGFFVFAFAFFLKLSRHTMLFLSSSLHGRD